MKKSLSILLVVIMLLATFSVAVSGVSYITEIKDPSGQFICYEKDYNESVYIDKYLGDDTEVVIPPEIAGYKVEAISGEAFTNNKKIKAVAIPKTVEEIGSSAFKSCTQLETIYLLNHSVTVAPDSFEDTAFYNNEKNWENGALYLNKVLIATKPGISGEFVVKDGTTAIAQCAFENNTALTEVVLPDTVLFIPYGMFSGCSSLEKVSLSKNTEYISYSAFENCTQLDNVVIPASVRLIQSDAFLNCKKLKSIKIESTDLDISDSAFDGTPYYDNTAKWDKGVFYVDKHLLYANPDVVAGDYKIKEGTITISSRAFYECDNLTSITIPKSVTKIRENTFYDCNNMKKVIISDGVKTIGDFAFEGCEKLTDIKVSDSIETIGWRAFDDTGYYIDKSNWENGVLYLGKYIIGVNEDFKEKNYTIKEGTKVIAEWGMAGSQELENLIIPEGLIAINEQAFNSCKKLKKVTVPDSVKNISKDAFIFCDDVEIHARNSYVYEYAKENNIKFVPLSTLPLLEYDEDKTVPTSQGNENTIETDTKVDETTRNESLTSEDVEDCDKNVTGEVMEKPTKPEKVSLITAQSLIIILTVFIIAALIAVAILIIYKKRKNK